MNRQAERQAGAGTQTSRADRLATILNDTIAAAYDIVTNLLDGLKLDGAGDRRIKAWQRH
jgi:hypothetical protein